MLHYKGIKFEEMRLRFFKSICHHEDYWIDCSGENFSGKQRYQSYYENNKSGNFYNSCVPQFSHLLYCLIYSSHRDKTKLISKKSPSPIIHTISTFRLDAESKRPGTESVTEDAGKKWLLMSYGNMEISFWRYILWWRNFATHSSKTSWDFA